MKPELVGYELASMNIDYEWYGIREHCINSYLAKSVQSNTTDEDMDAFTVEEIASMIMDGYLIAGDRAKIKVDDDINCSVSHYPIRDLIMLGISAFDALGLWPTGKR